MAHLSKDSAQLLIDGGLPDAAEAKAHLEACPECRGLVEALRDAQPTATLRPQPRLPAVRPPEPPEPSEPSAAPLAPGEKVGRYVVQEQVGEGGMGVVYAAHDPELARRVALKLVRPEASSGGSEGAVRQRLLREAQAMAQLSHPNVVAVYDAGTLGERVFVAMELVEGTTIKRWIRAAPRTWREVLAAYLDAGRGLAAAHAAGIVHRDFKPENVFVGRDGRVRVGDFGLARSAGEAPAPVPERPSAPGDGRPLDEALTKAGTVLGTPGYIAPEQQAGRSGDGRSDQFSFCVSLWHALYGERPFTVQEDAPTAALRLREPPRGTKVPPRVRRVLERGLSTAPEERWPSMDDLIGALEADPTARRRRLLAAGAVFALAVAGAFAIVRLRTPAPCPDPALEAAGLWSAPARASTRAAFEKAGGAAAFERTSANVARAAEDWAKARHEACEASRRSAEPGALLRLACLERQKQEIETFVEVLGQVDASLVEKGALAAAALPRPSACANVRALSLVAPPPDDPRLRAEITSLRARLAIVEAYVQVDRRDAAEVAEPVVKRAVEIGWRPLEAEAQLALATAYSKAGEHVKAGPIFERAMLAAEAGGLDALAARIAALLAYDVGYILGRSEEGRALARRAHAMLERIGGDDYAEADLGRAEGSMAMSAGDTENALAALKRSLEINTRIRGPEHPTTILAMQNVGAVLSNGGHLAEAIPYLRRSVEGFERSVGEGAAGLIFPLSNLGSLLADLGRSGEGLPHAERAVAIAAKAAPGRHLGFSLMQLAYVLLVAERPAEALEKAQQAAAILEKASGTESADYGTALGQSAKAKLLLGDARGAAQDLRTCIRTIEKATGSALGVDFSDFPVWLAQAQLSLGEVDEALASLAVAHKVPDAIVMPLHRARMHFVTARAFVAARKDGERARALAHQARAEYEALPNQAARVAEIDAWLATLR